MSLCLADVVDFWTGIIVDHTIGYAYCIVCAAIMVGDPRRSDAIMSNKNNTAGLKIGLEIYLVVLLPWIRGGGYLSA